MTWMETLTTIWTNLQAIQDDETLVALRQEVQDIKTHILEILPMTEALAGDVAAIIQLAFEAGQQLLTPAGQRAIAKPLSRCQTWQDVGAVAAMRITAAKAAAEPPGEPVRDQA
jgi:hypothetical protein